MIELLLRQPVNAIVSGDRVMVGAVAKGVTTVTITASDSEGLAVEESFLVTVPNRPPRGTHPLPDLELQAGEESVTDLSDHFADPDGDSLRFTAESSDSTVAVARASRGRLTVSALARGTVTVTASDPGQLATTGAFEVTVPNGAPRVHAPISDRPLAAGGVIGMSLLDHFSDPDGISLVFRAWSSDSSVVSVDMAGSGLTIEAIAKGHAVITVTATDPASLEVASNFTVRVPNRAPRTVRTIGDQSVARGGRATLRSSRYFADPDGDTLSFAAESSDTAIASVRIHGAGIRIRGIEVGRASVRVTATDSEGLAAAQSFGVTVVRRNRAPKPEGSIPDQSLEPDGELTMEVSGFFSDPDGDDLTFAAQSSDAAVATSAISDDVLTIVAVATGTATVTVTATDPGDLSATQLFAVRVRQRGVAGDFDISLHFTDAVPAAHRPTLEDAASWWQSVLSDTEWPDVAVNGTTECRDVDVPLETVDDLVILVDLVEMDGELGTAARAGVCVKRDEADAFAPVLGYVRIDKADIDLLAQYDDL